MERFLRLDKAEFIGKAASLAAEAARPAHRARLSRGRCRRQRLPRQRAGLSRRSARRPHDQAAPMAMRSSRSLAFAYVEPALAAPGNGFRGNAAGRAMPRDHPCAMPRGTLPTRARAPDRGDCMAHALPTHARVVIIGGGIVGASIAYHLAKLGWRDIVLLERKRLTSGTTWHAAGLVGQLRATANLTKLAQYTTEPLCGARGRDRPGDRLHCSAAASRSRPTPSGSRSCMRGASMAKTFGLEVHRGRPGRNQAALAAAQRRRRRRRRPSAGRRADQPDRHHDGADQGRDDARRAK